MKNRPELAGITVYPPINQYNVSSSEEIKSDTFKIEIEFYNLLTLEEFNDAVGNHLYDLIRNKIESKFNKE